MLIINVQERVKMAKCQTGWRNLQMSLKENFTSLDKSIADFHSNNISRKLKDIWGKHSSNEVSVWYEK